MDEEAWRQKLEPEQYRVLRQKGTEPPFSGKLLHNHETGVYICGACGNELFHSDSKFDSGSGWPSFDEVMSSSAVNLIPDDSHGMHRIEVQCASCQSHLGHLFEDGPTKTGKRYCINSLALDFTEKHE